jgi:predicted nucleotidyltransferase
MFMKQAFEREPVFLLIMGYHQVRYSKKLKYNRTAQKGCAVRLYFWILSKEIAVKQIIRQKLKALEQKHNIKILFACESGSRAWGFASPDSDYDVRFIYVHKREHYLSVEDQRDVIELPVDEVLDINGWELRKALRLFRKSNGPLYEWLGSPVIYQAEEDFLQEMKGLMPLYFSQRASMHHYLSMAKGVIEDELSESEVRLKKYFYALRPVLACRWIADRSEVPPMEFSKLRVSLEDDINIIVDDLLKQKALVDEKFKIGKIDRLDDFIREQMVYGKKAVPDSGNVAMDDEPLNRIFRKFII